MKQLICVNVGSAGINIGLKLWQNYGKEHGINEVGQQGKEQTIYNDHVIFSQSPSGKYVPRNLFIDNDRDTIDWIRKDKNRKLYNHNYSIAGKEDASNNYCRGNRISREIMDEAEDKIYKQIENCNNVEGIIFNFALSGGTGSSFTPLLLQKLSVSGHLKKKTVILNALISSPHMSDIIVEPYNVVMGLGDIININNNQSMMIAYDNQQLYKYSQAQDIDSAGYNEINQYIAKTTSILTNNIRIKICDFSLSEITTNTIPYRRTNILTPSLTFAQTEMKEGKVIDALYSKESRLNSYSMSNEKMMGSYGAFRGQINRFQLLRKIEEHKKNQIMVQCCPGHIKLALSEKQLRNSSTQSHYEGLILRNSTGILQFFDNIHSKYQRLYQKRAFAHWFVGQGMSNQSFNCPREASISLQRDYQQMCHEVGQQQSQSSQI